ncbi:MAG: DUF1232 domain-containing protein [Acidobacteriota bacterium]
MTEVPTDHQLTGNISPDGARRFYDRLRANIHGYVARKGSAAGKGAEYLLLVPDVFVLLYRLTTDKRVHGKNKVLLGSALVYFLSPVDLIPELLLGPIGLLDDLVFAVYVLNRLLVDTDPEILRGHWSGGEDVLAMISRVTSAADHLVSTKVLDRIRKMAK